ncbi:MAG: hypothetical protein IIA44_13540 [Acidobacteria bacterium]|nr:hypothetical protein [Acidobacteriota bacterium]
MVSGILDFEHCKGGDPANEVAWCDSYLANWWDGLTGETSTPIPTAALINGYRSGARKIDDAFLQRAQWHQLRNTVGALAYHGVNDVDTAGMLAFLREKLSEALERGREHLA